MTALYDQKMDFSQIAVGTCSTDRESSEPEPLEREGAFICIQCDPKIVYADVAALRTHQASHTLRTFVCPVCGNCFSRQHDLKRHTRLHDGIKPFSCHNCGKSFSRQDALGRHQRGDVGNGCSIKLPSSPKIVVWDKSPLPIAKMTSPQETSPELSDPAGASKEIIFIPSIATLSKNSAMKRRLENQHHILPMESSSNDELIHMRNDLLEAKSKIVRLTMQLMDVDELESANGRLQLRVEELESERKMLRTIIHDNCVNLDPTGNPITQTANPGMEADFLSFEVSSVEEEEEEVPVISRRRTEVLGDLSILMPLPIPAWVPEKTAYSYDLARAFNQEISDYLAYVKATPNEKALRLLALSRLENVIAQEFPNAKMSVFGSFATGLYLPSSDMDVVIIGAHENKVQCLHALKRGLDKACITSKIEVIAHAKIPILKMVDSITNFNIDVCFGATNGIIAANMVKNFLNDHKIGKALEGLMMILKQFLLQRNLNEVYTGGLSSYALLLLIASFLRLHPKIQTGEIVAHDNIGILLIEFFELYGKYFNFDKLGVGINNNETWYFNKRDYGMVNLGKPNNACILDPNDPSNDISRGSYAFTGVRNQFKSAYQSLIAVIGRGYQREVKNEFIPKYDESKFVITVLGQILTIDRNVLDHREFLQSTYEEIMGRKEDIPTYQNDGYKRAQNRPSKKEHIRVDLEESEEIIYISGSSEEEEAVAKKSQHGNKRKSGSQKSSDDSGGINSYYNLNPNDVSLRDLDGLDYSENHKRKRKKKRGN